MYDLLCVYLQFFYASYVSGITISCNVLTLNFVFQISTICPRNKKKPILHK